MNTKIGAVITKEEEHVEHVMRGADGRLYRITVEQTLFMDEEEEVLAQQTNRSVYSLTIQMHG